MNKLIAIILPAAITALAFSFSASAGVAPTTPNSALAQSGATIAAPARQSEEDKKDHQEVTPKDSAK